MKVVISISFYLALIALTAGNTGCFTTTEMIDLYPLANYRFMVRSIDDVGDMKYSSANWKNTHKYKRAASQSRAKTISIESTMRVDEKEYLDGLCNDCHDLKRVFLKRGSSSTWKNVLNQEQHQEIGLEDEEIDRLLQIFARHLSNYYLSALKFRTPK